ncbi:MAG: SufD family Fe-S cluster assembly protein [Chloroflexi bacterium]|nr:SufD family Fe-S cluster assembly protein [Chloroflexota bacterium]
MLEVGFVAEQAMRSGSFVQKDNSAVIASSGQPGIEVMRISQALKKYDWLKDYYWKAVEVDKDKYTAHVEINDADGYFIRSLPGVKSDMPIQTCLYISSANSIQDVHNIIIAEEGSELHIITGCTVDHGADHALHVGVSEFYVKKDSTISFTMIHNWSKTTDVRPRTGIIIDENGTYLNNYVLMRPVGTIQSYPMARCVGKNAVARFNSVIVCPKGSLMDIGGGVLLEAEGSRAEIVARSITTGGEVISRGIMSATAPNVKGHLECTSLIMDQGGISDAIPQLRATVPNVDLTHEAAVGRIDEEEIEYLMSRGMSREKATATIVRGFLNMDISGLPAVLNDEIKKAIETAQEGI